MHTMASGQISTSPTPTLTSSSSCLIMMSAWATWSSSAPLVTDEPSSVEALPSQLAS